MDTATEQALPRMLAGYLPARILHAAAELGVADAIGDGPADAAEVARRTGTDPDALRRLLRALAGLGLTEQLDADRFALTALGRGLRSGADGSFRDDVLLSVTAELWQAWGALGRVIRTGEPWRDAGTGLTARESALRDPVLAPKYRAAQARATAEFAAGLVRVCDFTRFATIADLGGDDGALLAAVLTAAPGARGLLADLPVALDGARAALESAGVADRCEVVAADRAESVPPGADAYLLNHLVRDLADGAAVALLGRCRAAMGPGARLLVLETVLPAVLGPADSVTYGLTDLNNLVYTGGRERTAAEYRGLLEAAGFAHVSTAVVPAAEGLPDYNAIEAEPAR
ncbi:methyltransferase [Actinomadura sp. NAK00032]|uniref:methyltransferase n=1 Tax=Actinomadura sp. NAK00032 TaxID=2742128 RepID=UPI00159001DE|nr:methyltransferase [Actinomadura sp. NAK00032]QKW35623.1 methyltransferase [Actinomadura sp. NAK00032]